MTQDLQGFCFRMFFYLINIAFGGGLIWFAIANNLDMHPFSLFLAATMLIFGCILASAEILIDAD